MISYIIYSNQGEICGDGTCQPDDFEAISQIHNIVEGSASSATHYVLNGQLTEYSIAQREAKNNKPSTAKFWSNALMAWEPHDPVEILAQEKIKKWSEIKSQRAALEVEPIEFNGCSFDADMTSQQRIAGGVQFAILSNNEWTIDWILSDNSTQTLSKTEMISLGVLLAERTASLYQRSQSARQQIDAALTLEELSAIAF